MSLSNKQECPSCRKSTFEVHIRPNPILDKVISDWKEARYALSFGWKCNAIDFVRQAFYSATPEEERKKYGEAGRGQGDV